MKQNHLKLHYSSLTRWIGRFTSYQWSWLKNALVGHIWISILWAWLTKQNAVVSTHLSDTNSITDWWRVLLAHDLVSHYNSIVALLGTDMQLSVSTRFAASGHYYTNGSWKLQPPETLYTIWKEVGDFEIFWIWGSQQLKPFNI